VIRTEVSAARKRTPVRGSEPLYSPAGAIEAAVGAAVNRYQPRLVIDDADVARETGVALRIMAWLRVVVITVCVPAFLVGGIGAACNAPEPVWITGMLVSSTSMTGGGFAALIATRNPLRWMPRLRVTAAACCLVGGIQAVVVLGSGLASSATNAGVRLTPAIGLAFLPAALMGAAAIAVLGLSRRMHPYFKATRGGSR
jgi:hypothetical protein